MEWIVVTGVWLFFAIFVAVYAVEKGRSGGLWLFFALMLSPLLAAVLLAMLPNSGGLQDVVAPTRYPCPHCAEPILPAAKLCPHCRSPLAAVNAAPRSAA